MKNRQAKQGFTLIELLVVVLIIGILAAVALPQYQKAVVKSHLIQLKTLVASVSQAAEVYYLENNQYPSTLEELTLDFPESASTQEESGRYDARFYSWGFCYLGKSAGSNNFTCYDSRSQIGYTHFFNFISSNMALPGETWCSSAIGSTAEQVCQQETGKSSFSSAMPIWDFTDTLHMYSY